MKRFHIGTIAATGAAALISIGVYAATNTESQKDAAAVAQATISLTQAIGAAEQHANGKASKAEYERTAKRGQWVYEVEVVAGTKVFDVRVDPGTGAILSSTEDKTDNDDEHDQTD